MTVDVRQAERGNHASIDVGSVPAGLAPPALPSAAMTRTRADAVLVDDAELVDAELIEAILSTQRAQVWPALRNCVGGAAIFAAPVGLFAVATFGMVGAYLGAAAFASAAALGALRYRRDLGADHGVSERVMARVLKSAMVARQRGMFRLGEKDDAVIARATLAVLRGG